MTDTVRIGVDTGGTFTDVVLADGTSGRLHHLKTPSTPPAFDVGVLVGIDEILQTAGRTGSSVRFLSHGTTVGTNAVLEGAMPPLGLLTNEGLRDVLEIGDQTRPALYDLQVEKPPAPIPRHRRLEVPGRIDAQGAELDSLDEERAVAAIERLVASDVDSIVVSMLFSYLNPVHERRIGELVEEVAPGIDVALTSDVYPERREYERTITTVLNEGIRRTLADYLGRLRSGVRDRGIEVPVNVMHSGGGIFTTEQACTRAIRTVLSGPAAGAVATRHLGERESFSTAIGMDMGGTSTDVSILRDGTLVRRTEGTIDGLPIAVPMIDIATVGAGGGSVVWIDEGGGLRVGPRSAGADPGPVCYGRGGDDLTVTDANLLLGRLNPDAFLGGRMELEVDRTHDLFERSIAEPLDLSVPAAAMSVIEVANARLIRELRRVTVERGDDPSDFVLVGFGGAGPLHAGAVSAELDMDATIVPPNPGVFSAHGLLLADVRIDESHAYRGRSPDADAIRSQFAELERTIRSRLEDQGFDPADGEIDRSLDLRYVGQSYELSVGMPSKSIDERAVMGCIDGFHEEHERRYGHSMPEEPVEVVTLRTTGVVPRETLGGSDAGDDVPSTGERPSNEPRDREVYFADIGFVDAAVERRATLTPGTTIEGPAIVEELGSTTVVPPKMRADVTRYGSIVIRR